MTDTEYKVLSDGRRLDVLLSEETGLSRSRVASLMENGLCVSGGKACTKAGTKLPAGQEIILTVPAPKEAVPKAEDIPLEILYEDEDLAVVIKPRGMVVHPAAGHPDGTLVNALLARLDSLGGIGGELRPGIVHRLDKETSGLMLVAKNDGTQEALRPVQRAGRRNQCAHRPQQKRPEENGGGSGRTSCTDPLESVGGGAGLHASGCTYPDRAGICQTSRQPRCCQSPPP